MPGCAAVDCHNSAKKGFLMKRFPTDPARRAVWAVKVKRESSWYPTNTSYLCEVHFEPDQWERTRVDGSRKLKCTAVPTLFKHTGMTPKVKRKPPVDRSSVGLPKKKIKPLSAVKNLVPSTRIHVQENIQPECAQQNSPEIIVQFAKRGTILDSEIRLQDKQTSTDDDFQSYQKELDEKIKTIRKLQAELFLFQKVCAKQNKRIVNLKRKLNSNAVYKYRLLKKVLL